MKWCSKCSEKSNQPAAAAQWNSNRKKNDDNEKASNADQNDVIIIMQYEYWMKYLKLLLHILSRISYPLHYGNVQKKKYKTMKILDPFE